MKNTTKNKQSYKLEDFGEIVARHDDGTPFIAYREPTVDINQDKMQFNFEDRVRQLTKQYPNDMELGSKIRELILNNNNKMEK